MDPSATQHQSSAPPGGGGGSSGQPPQHQAVHQQQQPTSVQSIKMEAPMHEGDSLRSYQPPGFYGVSQQQQPDMYGMQLQQAPQAPPPLIQYCRNPCDGTILRDQHNVAVSIPKVLATKPLRHEIQTRPGPGGKKMAYMGGEQVVRSLNEIFGFDGWDFTVLEVRREDQGRDNGKYNVCYVAHVRITIKHSGAFREDWGTREATDKALGKAIDTALKGSITDALKRAARLLGDKLGNDIGTINSAPKTLQNALDAYDIQQANTKFGFKKKAAAAPPPPPAQIAHTAASSHAKAPSHAKPMHGSSTNNAASAVNHQANNNNHNKIIPAPHAHAQKQHTTNSNVHQTQKVAPQPLQASGQQHVQGQTYAAAPTTMNTSNAPVPRPTSSYGRPNTANHFTNKPSISVGPSVTATAATTATANNAVDNTRRVSLEQPPTMANSNNNGNPPPNPYHQQGQPHSNAAPPPPVAATTTAVTPGMQVAGMQTTAQSAHSAPPTQPHKRPPLHSLPTTDSYTAAATPLTQNVMQQQQQVKRPASAMTNPYSQQNSYPNKGGVAGRHSM